MCSLFRREVLNPRVNFVLPSTYKPKGCPQNYMGESRILNMFLIMLGMRICFKSHSHKLFPFVKAIILILWLLPLHPSEEKKKNQQRTI